MSGSFTPIQLMGTYVHCPRHAQLDGVYLGGKSA